MNLPEILTSIADAATSDLIALGKAIYDILEKRHQDQVTAIAAAGVQAVEVAADVAEAEKFPTG